MAEWAAKRFWKAATCEPRGPGFAIHLDGRPLNTPAKAPVILPTLALARAVADEWQAQGERIEPLSMPFTRSANAAIDKVAPQREVVQRMIADYCDTDLLCYRAGSPARLIALQAERWDPLLDWAHATFGARLNVTTGVMPVEQPAVAVQALTATMDGMSDFALVAFHDLVSLSGSFVLGLAVARGHVVPEAGWALSRTDEEWQAGLWGSDDEAEKAAAIKRAGFLHAHRFLRLADPDHRDGPSR